MATLVRQYGAERTVRKGYRPAALIQAILEHVMSPDTFLRFFFAYIYEYICSNGEPADGYDITTSLSYLDGLAPWKPEQIRSLNEALEKFAEYIVENFLLPGMLLASV